MNNSYTYNETGSYNVGDLTTSDFIETNVAIGTNVVIGVTGTGITTGVTGTGITTGVTGTGITTGVTGTGTDDIHNDIIWLADGFKIHGKNIIIDIFKMREQIISLERKLLYLENANPDLMGKVHEAATKIQRW